jgi:DNA-binding XRE family transcriptional regulator
MDSKALTARKDGTFRGYMKQRTNFGKYLEEHGYSTNTFADKVGISQPTIWRLSTGTFKLYNPELVETINTVISTEYGNKDFVGFVEKDFRV